ncbi:hypothetical protein GCM10023185_08170 [Hymenobacter saemangeumensis]|uniref:PEGA domain-containing protein n=1 Tax=Hymenobacter saemangeumensis TaxID=1084522 RepID=A0ABP8I3C9_9BACT
MKRIYLVGLALAGSLLSGCASIVSNTRWPVTISSTPAGATVTVLGRDGLEVFSGPTPAAVLLKSGAGYFQKAKYTLKFTMPGYEPKTMNLEADINGWYFGNLFIGGPLGLLIVDPLTGAMFRIDQREVQASLTQAQGLHLPYTDVNGLQIVSITDIPSTERHLLIPIN